MTECRLNSERFLGRQIMVKEDHISVQIYEIQTPVEAEAVLDCDVDCIGGVVLSEQAWKDQSLLEAVGMVRQAGVRSSIIPLFSAADSIYRVLDYYQPDIVHLCDALDRVSAASAPFTALIQLQAGIRDRFPGVGIMRSIPIVQNGAATSTNPIALAVMFEPVSDYFLIDTVLAKDGATAAADQPVNGFVGITGIPCDWRIAGELTRSAAIPVILAGGLGPDNVYDAIMTVRPAGVDSCTGTNRRDTSGMPIRFKKDIERVRRFVEETRRAESQLIQAAAM
jgi:phosphoribosylanthranilate isomerase